MNTHFPSVTKAITFLATVFLLFSCANTKITQSWTDPDNKKVYKDLLVIGVAESEQNRRIFETQFIQKLRKDGIEAVASYTLLDSTVEINRNTVTNAIKGLDIDGVIITHLVSDKEESVYRPGTVVNAGGYGGYGGYGRGMYGYNSYVNSYVSTPGYYQSVQTYVLETNLFDVETEKLIWSARSRTFAPDSVDELIVDLVELIVTNLEEKNLIQKK
jgi:hypothetical protein